MSRAVCPKCGNTDVSWIRDYDDYAQYTCPECKQGFCYPPKTLFKHITTSPEVLAKEFVTEFSVYGGRSYWCSLLLAEPGHSVFEQRFNTEDEAIAATLARLNSLITYVKEKVE